MSHEGQDRTEEASPRRREEARKQGQVAFSPDFLGSALLLGGVVGIMYLGPAMGARIRDAVVETFRSPFPVELGPSEAASLLARAFVQFLQIVGPLLGALLAVGVGVSLLQVGFHITPERLGPDFERLSPVNGMGKLFSLAAMFKGALALVKIVVLGALIYIVLRARAGLFASLGMGDVGFAAQTSWELTLRIALYLAIAFAIIGAGDYIFQRYRFEQSLRMTKQEVKEEVKREEGDPQIKARMRQMQREMGRRRMLAEVPKATVVITNPIHYAVALRYDRTMRAPRVVARGAGVLARRIADRARECAIPVLERPPLARALFRAVDVGRDVPPEMFVALAEVIAFVYRLRGVDNFGPRADEG